jgi:integrase
MAIGRTGSHPNRALTAISVKNKTHAGRYADGNGLYLVVDPSGAKRWVLRTVVHGRRRDIGLGGTRLVSLVEAREKAATLRKIARDGGDPLAAKRRASVMVPTFEEAARHAHAAHKAAWRNEKHAAQWMTTLERYALSYMGQIPVDQVGTPDVHRVLSPIWLSKPETARRVRQRIGTVLDWAKTSGFRTGENPVDGVGKGLPRQPERKGHFTAMAYQDLPGFIARLREHDGPGEYARLALEFLILSAARTSEVLGALWPEIDIDYTIWTVPAARMKTGRDHRVPLAMRAIEILERASVLSAGSELVFAGRSPDRPMSNMVFLMTLRRMGVAATAHGFRSAFRDWAAEETNFPRDVCEAALAHAIENKTEAAYRRGDLFDKRRDLMNAWEKFLGPSWR